MNGTSVLEPIPTDMTMYGASSLLANTLAAGAWPFFADDEIEAVDAGFALRQSKLLDGSGGASCLSPSLRPLPAANMLWRWLMGQWLWSAP